jgi:thioredoxin reductase (NADPH)
MSATALPSERNELVDCLVIGGGPAGLTAAIYLTRFHLSTIVIDNGQSRAASIPMTHNHAGFPDGISGPDLLDQMRRQAKTYGADLRVGEILRLERTNEGLVAETENGRLAARAVLLATGVINRRPAMDDASHAEALSRGLLRYCPVCDGYEVTDKRIAVLGTGQRGCDEALFLRGFTADVTLVAPGVAHDFSLDQQCELHAAGVKLAGTCAAIRLTGDSIELELPTGSSRFASLYPALGSEIRSHLARQVGASISEEGCLLVDAHQRTDVSGLYAAGDVVLGLDQISHAMGEGGVAATTIRNDLARIRPLRR